MRLAKIGFFSGDPQAILEGRVDIVQAMIDFEIFEADYGREYEALNKPEGS